MSLARGWSPTRRQVIAARLVVGTLLLVTPLWVGYVPLDLDGTEYHYRTTDVRVVDGRLAFEADREVTQYHGIGGIACSSENPFVRERVCGFERRLAAEGPTTVPSVLEEHRGPEFVQVGDAYYRRGGNRTENGTRYSLERVNPATVLEELAEPPTQLSLAGEWAGRTGSVTTGERASFEGQIVRRSDGSYELVYRWGYRRSSDAGAEPVVWLFGIGGGVALLWSGYGRLEA